MAMVPGEPKIYHITHVRNLRQIVAAGRLYSDAKRIEKHLDCDVVGMSHIKRRRLTEIEVDCHPGTRVGDYVPFYFCPRSIMLFILHKGNHPDLNYTEGQSPIVHLEADLHRVIEWAEKRGRRWAFSDRNAGTYYAHFFNAKGHLERLNWQAIGTTHWSDATIKDSKQAEFLLHLSFPWHLFEQIGVIDEARRAEVIQAIKSADHRPVVSVKKNWYY